MKSSEIVSYFSHKNMGSHILNLVDLVWEKLDDTEKQFAVSLKNSKLCQFYLRSALSQKELDAEVSATPYIELS